MAEIVNTILKHPGEPDKTLNDVLHDVVNRQVAGRTLVRYQINAAEVVLVYETRA